MESNKAKASGSETDSNPWNEFSKGGGGGEVAVGITAAAVDLYPIFYLKS